jgi:mannose-6-phosphate isomerase-like protein (cupin superfamily)
MNIPVHLEMVLQSADTQVYIYEITLTPKECKIFRRIGQQWLSSGSRSILFSGCPAATSICKKDVKMSICKISIREKASLIKELHQYKIIAEMNDYYFKLVKAKREFVWHAHPETDEVFLVVEGAFDLALRDGTIRLSEGEMAVVPKGIEHKPICKEECCVMLIEPKTTVNTGTAGGELTDTNLEWI